jgi:hypothetical protein
MEEPIVNKMINDITEVIDGYRVSYAISYAELIGVLSILKMDIYKEMGEDEDF